MTLAILLLCGGIVHAQDRADVIYVNGHVVTLDPQSRVVTALATSGDRILAVGSDAEVRALADSHTVVHDLAGKTLIPGLYAAHDHFPGSGRLGLFTADLNSPPIGSIQTMDDLVEVLKQRAANLPEGKWVTGRGYDDTLLKEQRHPTRADLDRVSKTHPVWITHISGHLGVGNSLALQKAKITRETPQPVGGRIQIDPATGEPNGVFEECGGMVSKFIPGLSENQQLQVTQAAVDQYNRQGVTTSVIAAGGTDTVRNLKLAIQEGIVNFRIVTMTSGGPYPAARAIAEELNSPLLKVGAIKLLQDGSIQGFTGYLAAPYYRPRPGEAEYRGYAMRSREALTKRVKELHQQGFQLAIHGNGDEAIDDILHAYGEAQKELPRPDARHRIEHCQTAREDQLDRMKELGVTPSFFVGHVYYWGDRHRDIFLGPERGARISPLASASARAICYTLHDDTPVTPVNPLQLVWVASNRLTSSGQILGPEQRVSVEMALRAVTIDAAWQNFEEATKGSLEPGKLADCVVLDHNPLTIDAGEISSLRVLQTIVGGRTIYSAEGSEGASQELRHRAAR